MRCLVLTAAGASSGSDWITLPSMGNSSRGLTCSPLPGADSDASYIFVFFDCCLPNKGRPSIVAVGIRSRVVRIHRTRRTIRVVRIVPKTESRFSKPVFQPCSGRIQRSLSRCRTCPLHMDFFAFFSKRRRVGLRKDRPINALPSVILAEGRCACSALREMNGGCTPVALACSLLHYPHSRTWADPP